ncbi:MAG: hypothetical protein ABEJ02_02765 [Candidatus Paceibacteria bacterium]
MRVLIHSMMMYVHLLQGEVDELKNYSGRALLAPRSYGAVVYDTETARRYARYLRNLELGPEKVWFVEQKGKTLFHALNQSGTLQKVLKAADSIAPFVSWEKTNQFREEWGLDHGRWYGQDREDHVSLENKAQLRRRFPDSWFSEYEIFPAGDISGIQEYGFRLMAKYGKILVRHPKKASGVGLRFLEDSEELHSSKLIEFLQGFAGEELLVEQFFSGAEEYSITWERGLGGEPRQLYWSGQFIKSGVHQGNLIASPETLLPEEAQGAIEEIEAATREIVSNHDSPGRYGFDLLIRPNGEWVVIECNCRYGGSAYPAFVRENVGEDRCVIMHNVYPETAESFEEVHEAFEELGLDYDPSSREGALVGNPFALPAKCAAVIVANKPDEVKGMLKRIQNNL